ncbi:hypothetical protein QBC45DRAFT_183232 [Copromyces sp. CBS 386.78]|nr:hypothetical protein QBC45DRAFT_183232 [Copromyces sp. CBS 386.78]
MRERHGVSSLAMMVWCLGFGVGRYGKASSFYFIFFSLHQQDMQAGKVVCHGKGVGEQRNVNEGRGIEWEPA